MPRYLEDLVSGEMIKGIRRQIELILMELDSAIVILVSPKEDRKYLHATIEALFHGQEEEGHLSHVNIMESFMDICNNCAVQRDQLGS